MNISWIRAKKEKRKKKHFLLSLSMLCGRIDCPTVSIWRFVWDDLNIWSISGGHSIFKARKRFAMFAHMWAIKRKIGEIRWKISRQDNYPLILYEICSFKDILQISKTDCGYSFGFKISSFFFFSNRLFLLNAVFIF